MALTELAKRQEPAALCSIIEVETGKVQGVFSALKKIIIYSSLVQYTLTVALCHGRNVLHLKRTFISVMK